MQQGCWKFNELQWVDGEEAGMRRTRIGWVVLVLLGGPAWAGAQEAPLALRVEQAVERALAQNLSLRGTGLDLAAAEARRKQARSQFGPKLQVELRALFFDEAPSIGSSGLDPDSLALLQQLAGQDPFDNAMIEFFGALPSLFQSEDYDVNLAARLVQPLTPLWAVYQMYKLAEIEVDVVRVAAERTRLELVFQVREVCLRVLQAEAGLAALDEAIGTVEAHLERARHFLEAGLIGRDDLLEAEVRLADLKGKRLEIRHAAQMARASLAVLLNEPSEREIQVVGFAEPVDTHAPPGLEQTLAEAYGLRPELRELDLRIAQAERGVRASWQGYIPTVAAMAQYQYNKGSVMAPPTWTGGVLVDFNVWEWGATYYQQEEAEARLARARLGREELQRGIALQVRSAWLKIQQSLEQIQIAQAAVVQSVEQLRLERQRYEAQQSTSTEVLDAQNRLTQAKVTVASAGIELRIARAALDKAVGRPVESDSAAVKSGSTLATPGEQP
jgi:outer membrane protein TolC